jgi:hypothetical protein
MKSVHLRVDIVANLDDVSAASMSSFLSRQVELIEGSQSASYSGLSGNGEARRAVWKTSGG